MRSVRALLVVVLALVSLLLTTGAGRVQAAAGDLFISEYVEGTSFNKALEIFNPSGASVDLAAEGYSVQVFSNGSTTASLTVNLSGVVAPGDVHVVIHPSADAAVPSTSGRA
jgi:predicted extracellular nuclease